MKPLERLVIALILLILALSYQSYRNSRVPKSDLGENVHFISKTGIKRIENMFSDLKENAERYNENKVFYISLVWELSQYCIMVLHKRRLCRYVMYFLFPSHIMII